MSKMERPPALGSTKVTVYGQGDMRAAGTAMPSLGQHVLIFALFTGWIGFWIAVIWWIAR